MISKQVNYKVRCVDCDKAREINCNTLHQLEEKLRKDGWTITLATGTVRCPKCRRSYGKE